MTNPGQIDIEVFRSGDYGPKGRFTEEDLDAIASGYDPALHEAPVTFDHEQKGPAHGWVTGLRRIGDRLVATIARLSDALYTALRSQTFKKRSIELYKRFAATGGPYLKAVSFLGAASPEVKGLQDPVFREEEAPETVCFEEEIAPPPPSPRERLMSEGAWRPEWEEQGLPEVFEALEGSPALETLLAFLCRQEPAVPFGEMERDPETETSAFAENLSGGASGESLKRHREAAAMVRRNPSLSYRDALLKLS